MVWLDASERARVLREWLNRRTTASGWVENLSSIVLALVLSMIVWLVANEESRPMASQWFPALAADSPAIEFRNVPDDWAVLEPSVRTVRLRLRGIGSELTDLEPGDFEITVDLGDLGPDATSGTVPIEVRCRDSCRRRGVRITELRPDEVTVSIAAVITQTRAVVLIQDGEWPNGYKGSFSVEPDSVSVVGPEAALTEVSRVKALVTGLSNVHTERTRSVPVLAVDAGEEEVLDVTLVPARVAITMRPSRSGVLVSVVPDLIGWDAVTEGYLPGRVLVDPPRVELEGPVDAVRDLGNEGLVRTVPVDLTGAVEDLQERVLLVLPDGVTAMNAPEGVTVTVEVEALLGTKTLDVPVAKRRLGDGLVADVTPDVVQLILSGPRPELERITAEDVEAYVDLVNLTSGTHRRPVRVEPPEGMTVRSATPEEVDVVIRDAARIRSTPAVGITPTR